MGRLRATKDALKTLVESAVSSDVAVLVWHPDAIDQIRHAKFVAIWPASGIYEPNILLGPNLLQESEWGWEFRIGAGYGDDMSSALDEIDDILAELDTSLAGTRPVTNGGMLQVREHHDLSDITETHIVVRQLWVHDRPAE